MADGRLSPNLTRMADEHSRLRRNRIRDTLAAAAPVFKTTREQGAGAGLELARAMIPQDAPYDPNGAVKAKADILKNMANNRDKLQSMEAGLAEKLLAQKSNIVDIARLAADAAGLDQSGSNKFAEEVNKASVTLTQEANQNVIQLLTKAAGNTGVTGAVVKGLEAFRALAKTRGQAGLPGQTLPADQARLLRDITTQMQAEGDDAGLALLRQHMDFIAANDYGEPNGSTALLSGLSASTPAGSQELEQAVGALNSEGPATRLQEATSLALDTALANNIAAMQGIVAPGQKGQAALNYFNDLLSDPKVVGIIGGQLDPSKLGSVLVEVVQKLPSMANAADDRQRWLDLLTQVDRSDLPPTSAPAEAKRRIQKDPAFVQFMQDENLLDPDLALRELHRRVREQHRADREHDREVLAGATPPDTVMESSVEPQVAPSQLEAPSAGSPEGSSPPPSGEPIAPPAVPQAGARARARDILKERLSQ